MTTPAGWYDDGSGRQRWWDGQQWTEHFAPETAAPESPLASPDAESSAAEAGTTASEAAHSEPAATESAATESTDAHEPSLDDTWVRPSNETVINPDSDSTASASESAPAESAPAESAPVESAPVESAPAEAAYPPPVTPAAAPPSYAPAAPAYPGSASFEQPGGAYAPPSGGYPGTAPYGSPAPEAPKKVSVLGLVGLGLSVVGTILVFVPVVGLFGFFLLAAGFIVSLISIFLKGKKWPGITGLILAVVGTIVGVVMSFVFLFAFAQGVNEEIDSFPSSSPSAPSTTPEETAAPDSGTGTRPTSAEVALGLTTLIEATGAEGYTAEQITCFADEFVASPLDDATLRKIADSDGTFTDSESASAFAEEFGNAIPVCLVP